MLSGRVLSGVLQNGSWACILLGNPLSDPAAAGEARRGCRRGPGKKEIGKRISEKNPRFGLRGPPRAARHGRAASRFLSFPSRPNSHFAKLHSVKKGGRYFPATSLARAGDSWHVEFGAAQVQADLRVETAAHYLVFELVRVQGDGVEEVRLADVQVACRESAGFWLGAYWDEQFTVALFGLSDEVHVPLLGSGTLAASVYPEFGLEGRRIVLAAAPTAQFLDVVQVAGVVSDQYEPLPRR